MIQYFTRGGNIVVFAAFVVVVIFVFDLLGLVYLILPIVGSKIDLLFSKLILGLDLNFGGVVDLLLSLGMVF